MSHEPRAEVVAVIPADILRALRIAVVHANCADGRASAVILKAALPHIEAREVAHDSREHREMQPEPGMIFCDFAPWAPKASAVPTPDELAARAEAMRPWADAGTIVLDHHKGAADLVRAFGKRGVFADEKAEPGVSGAVLAYCKVLERMMPHDASGRTKGALNLARLIGVRDTWQRSDPEWDRACAVSAAVRFLPLDEALTRGPAGVMAFAEEAGGLLVRKQLDAAREAAANAVRATIGGRRVAIISSVSLTSDVADVLGAEVDIVAGFDYVHSKDGVRLQWSLRGRNGVDVSAIARANGGNGHTAAAGFSVPVMTTDARDSRDPYEHAVRLLYSGGE